MSAEDIAAIVYLYRYDWRPYEMQDAINAGCGCWRPN